MAKKIKTSRIPQDVPLVDMAAFKGSDELPTKDEANETVKALTNQIDKEIQKLKIATKDKGRPMKENSIGRVKYTTSLNKSLIRFLKQKAIDSDRTAADILEDALLFYKNSFK